MKLNTGLSATCTTDVDDTICHIEIENAEGKETPGRLNGYRCRFSFFSTPGSPNGLKGMDFLLPHNPDGGWSTLLKHAMEMYQKHVDALMQTG